MDIRKHKPDVAVSYQWLPPADTMANGVEVVLREILQHQHAEDGGRGAESTDGIHLHHLQGKYPLCTCVKSKHILALDISHYISLC